MRVGHVEDRGGVCGREDSAAAHDEDLHRRAAADTARDTPWYRTQLQARLGCIVGPICEGWARKGTRQSLWPMGGRQGRGRLREGCAHSTSSRRSRVVSLGRIGNVAVLRAEEPLPRPHGSSVRTEAMACMVPLASRSVKFTTARMPPNGVPSSVTLASTRTPTALCVCTAEEPPAEWATAAGAIAGMLILMTMSLVEASPPHPVPATTCGLEGASRSPRSLARVALRKLTNSATGLETSVAMDGSYATWRKLVR